MIPTKLKLFYYVIKLALKCILCQISIILSQSFFLYFHHFLDDYPLGHISANKPHKRRSFARCLQITNNMFRLYKILRLLNLLTRFKVKPSLNAEYFQFYFKSIRNYFNSMTPLSTYFCINNIILLTI